MLQLLLTAFIFGLLTFGFFIIWIKNRVFFSAVLFSLSYACAGVAFGFESLYSFAKEYEYITPFSDTLYMLSALFFSVGLSLKFRQKTPLLLLGIIFAATFLTTHWYWFVEDNFNLRVEIISYGCAAMVAVGAISIHRRINSTLDKSLFFAVISFSIQLIFITVLTLRMNSEILGSSNFHSSTYLEFVHFSIAVFAIATAVLLFASLALEVIEGLQKTSDTDSLTKTHNRSSLERHAYSAIEAHHRNGQQLALIVCDIDHFKAANDLYGHQYGDKVLSSFVSILKDSRRKTDVVGRIGGDEFTILLPNANIQMAKLIAETARSRFDQKHKLDDADALYLTASFGIAGLIKGDTYETLFERADQMLYKAKKSGRNKVVIEDITDHSNQKTA